MDVLAIMPSELAQYLLTFCHPWDVATFARTCRRAYTLVYAGDQYLWKQLFLTHFDDLRDSLYVVRDFCGWREELTRRMKAELVTTRPSVVGYDMQERVAALETILSVIRDTPPIIDAARYPSRNLRWLDRVLRESCILTTFPSPEESTLWAKLRCHLPLFVDGEFSDEENMFLILSRRSQSRCVVYDFQNYSQETQWGPYSDDGKHVNWHHVESIINVILLNLQELPQVWAISRPPLGLSATRPYSAPGHHNPDDWAKVEGRWRRYVCFMDYRDLFAFNYSGMGFDARDPAMFDVPNFHEATRFEEIDLRLTSPDMMVHRQFSSVSSEDEDCCNPYFPTLYFTGSSRRENGHTSRLEGVVKMGWDDTVRWQFVSLYNGQAQWSSEGVQIANIGSATGVVGTWTTILHEEGDPVGPFWLWKVVDDFPSRYPGP